MLTGTEIATAITAAASRIDPRVLELARQVYLTDGGRSDLGPLLEWNEAQLIEYAWNAEQMIDLANDIEKVIQNWFDSQ